MKENSEHKRAATSTPIHELIARRWSPRAFIADKAVSREQIVALLEAARWAPSCFGAQPWRYVVCDRFVDEAAWRAALACLAEKNRLWAGNAPVLLIAAAREHFELNGKPNRWAQHDTGAASENICLQATALGLMAHQMGGFDADKIRQAFAVPDGYTPTSVIAVGYRGDEKNLAAEFAESERAPRTRKPLGECFFSGCWDKSYF